jgi:hypothetical protein
MQQTLVKEDDARAAGHGGLRGIEVEPPLLIGDVQQG